MRYSLAIDIGASSGRHILGWIADGKLHLEEIHRFPNTTLERNGHICWNLETLFSEVVIGMKKCADMGKVPASVAIDTWGVDFVLLDDNGQLLGDTIAYRDKRTNDCDTAVYAHISESELYARTGIQKQIFNTVFQLMSVKKNTPELLTQAESMLFVPDYLHYRLCGIKKTEYTIASTSGLLNAKTKDWDNEILERLGFPLNIFQEIVPPGTLLGCLTEEIKSAVGFNCNIVLPASHDTGSAFLAVPAQNDASVYLSSGTWSLMGVERNEPYISEISRKANFTNEGGYEYRFRCLKNIMGLWMIQSIKAELGGVTFAELEQIARECDFEGTVDVNAGRFLAPGSMIEEVRAESNSAANSIPEIVKCVYLSLARCYAETVQDLATFTGESFERIHIIGGGSKDTYLNELTCRACGLPVYVGPIEGAALGNLIVQMITGNELKNINEARALIQNSFRIAELLP